MKDLLLIITGLLLTGAGIAEMSKSKKAVIETVKDVAKDTGKPKQEKVKKVEVEAPEIKT